MSGVTREFVELFVEAGEDESGILQGLVGLWAIEHVSPPFYHELPKCSNISFEMKLHLLSAQCYLSA